MICERKGFGGKPQKKGKWLMKKVPCGIRIFCIEQMETKGKIGACWIEVEKGEKRSLFRIRCHSKGRYLLFPVEDSLMDVGLYDDILKGLLERKIILEGNKLVWMGRN